MITADQIIIHAIGDFVLQSDWMAQNKTKSWKPAIAHVIMYGIPFLFLTKSVLALSVIVGSHLVIDHWRLARYVCWAKNFISVRSSWPKPWRECQSTGYDPHSPPWMSVWLMIAVDQIMHLTINAFAIQYL